MVEAACFFHIGYQRTGSTFLQQAVFPAYGDYIHLRGTASFFINAEEFACGPEHYMAMNPAHVEAPVIIESHNGMCGDTLEDRPQVAARIKALCPDAKILLSIRSQFTIIPSFYFLHVKGGGTESYVEYVGKVVANGKFDFHRVVRTYRDLFGAESVLVMLYEDLQRDHTGFIKRFCDFIKIPYDIEIGVTNDVLKERSSDLAIRIMLLVSRGLDRLPFNHPSVAVASDRRRRLRKWKTIGIGVVSGLVPEAVSGLAEIETESQKPVIEAAYGESNQALFRLLDRDIREYAYPGAG